MNKLMSTLAFALVVTGAACSRANSKPADSTLNTDLSLAAQQKGYTPLDTISAAERAKANSLAAAPVASEPRSVTHHSTAHHSTSGGASSAGTATTASAPTVVKHTQRDAAIGAAAGAILGATTSKNKVKGGIIGAAVGGVLGGVLGNNVDKTKKP
ncbi:MAG TPA: YMGG-like glycine zipper-containing protein [Gemmatimonadaceae bacterium]